MSVGACEILVHWSVDATFSHKSQVKTLTKDLQREMKSTSFLASKVSKIRKHVMEANVFYHGGKDVRNPKVSTASNLTINICTPPTFVRRIQSAHVGIDPHVILQLLGQNHHVTTQILEDS